MRFIIRENKPYLCSGGRAYPVEIKDGKVRIDIENGSLSDEKGNFSLQEIVSKIGPNTSSIQRRESTSQGV